MTTDFEITDKELREVYELLTKEQLIEALIRKHKECRDIAKNCVIPAVMVELACPRCGSTNTAPSDKENDAGCYDCGFVWQDN